MARFLADWAHLRESVTAAVTSGERVLKGVGCAGVGGCWTLFRVPCMLRRPGAISWPNGVDSTSLGSSVM